MPGKISARVRGLMWRRVLEMVSNGRAIMVYGADDEQGLTFQVHEWHPIYHEGVQLMLRPAADGGDAQGPRQARRKGWSNASKRRKFDQR